MLNISFLENIKHYKVLKFAFDLDLLQSTKEVGLCPRKQHGDPTDKRESTSVFQIRTINRSKLDKRQVSVIDSRRK